MNKLKKIVVLFLILVITLPSETAHAFSFIPEFISHYKHHNEEHHQLSFIQFVGEHFSVGHHDGLKHHQQDECPVSHDHLIVSLTFILEKKATFEMVMEDNIFLLERGLIPPYHFSFSEFHASIWQPPKLS